MKRSSGIGNKHRAYSIEEALFITQGCEAKENLPKREYDLLVIAYKNGYEQGHHDTVESQYYDPEETAKEWVPDAIKDGTIIIP